MKVDLLNVSLPISKSIFNRALIIEALADGNCLKYKQSELCDDAKILYDVLHSSSSSFNVANAGTAMRFLTAFLSRIVGHWELTGSKRMLQRPIGPLVDALNSIGGHIEYLGEQGYPPLRISGSLLMGGEISISASVSSQYISAMLMIAPYMVNGLVIHLKDKVVSYPYIEMTRHVMHDFGVDVLRKDDSLIVHPHEYVLPDSYVVESDWSAASYFYELFAVKKSIDMLVLSGLFPSSIQGDAKQISIWEDLGVHSSFIPEGVLLTRCEQRIFNLEYDFSSMPDLVQTFVVACCLLNVTFYFTGLETLHIKETDRIQSMVSELRKLGFILEVSSNQAAIGWDGKKSTPDLAEALCPFGDHRMAMSLAAACVKFPSMNMADLEVVTKSFPEFWKEFAKCMQW